MCTLPSTPFPHNSANSEYSARAPSKCTNDTVPPSSDSQEASNNDLLSIDESIRKNHVHLSNIYSARDYVLLDIDSVSTQTWLGLRIPNASMQPSDAPEVFTILSQETNTTTSPRPHREVHSDYLLHLMHNAVAMCNLFDRAATDIANIPPIITISVLSIDLSPLKFQITEYLRFLRASVCRIVVTQVTCVCTHILAVMEATESVLVSEPTSPVEVASISKKASATCTFIGLWTPVLCYLVDLIPQLAFVGNPYWTHYNSTTSNVWAAKLANYPHGIETSAPCNACQEPSISPPSPRNEPLGKLSRTVYEAKLKPATSPCTPSVFSSSESLDTLVASALSGIYTSLVRVSYLKELSIRMMKPLRIQITLYSRLLLVYSDWISKRSSLLHGVAIEITRLKLEDLQCTVTDPHRFLAGFLLLANNITFELLEDFFRHSHLSEADFEFMPSFIASIQTATPLTISLAKASLVSAAPPQGIFSCTGEFSIFQLFSVRKDAAIPNRLSQPNSVESLLLNLDPVVTKQTNARWPYQYIRPSRGSLLRSTCGAPIFAPHSEAITLSRPTVSSNQVSMNEHPGCSAAGFDAPAMFLESLFLFVEVRKLYSIAMQMASALDVDLHITKPPTDVDSYITHACCIIYCIFCLSPLYVRLLDLPLAEADASRLVRLIEFGTSSVSHVRTASVFVSWSAIADRAHVALLDLAESILYIHYVSQLSASPEYLKHFSNLVHLPFILKPSTTSRDLIIASAASLRVQQCFFQARKFHDAFLRNASSYQTLEQSRVALSSLKITVNRLTVPASNTALFAHLADNFPASYRHGSKLSINKPPQCTHVCTTSPANSPKIPPTHSSLLCIELPKISLCNSFISLALCIVPNDIECLATLCELRFIVVHLLFMCASTQEQKSFRKTERDLVLCMTLVIVLHRSRRLLSEAIFLWNSLQYSSVVSESTAARTPSVNMRITRANFSLEKFTHTLLRSIECSARLAKSCVENNGCLLNTATTCCLIVEELVELPASLENALSCLGSSGYGTSDVTSAFVVPAAQFFLPRIPSIALVHGPAAIKAIISLPSFSLFKQQIFSTDRINIAFANENSISGFVSEVEEFAFCRPIPLPSTFSLLHDCLCDTTAQRTSL